MRVRGLRSWRYWLGGVRIPWLSTFLVTGVFSLFLIPDAGPRPLPPGTRADRILVEKERHLLTLYRGDEALRSYPVSLGRGGLAPKTREGDGRTPEGRYHIIGRNPNSAYHRSLHISYPAARDIEAASARGEPPGSDITIHGIPNGRERVGEWHRKIDWTAGCIAVTNAEIDEIWRVVPNGTPIEIRP